MKLPEAEWEVIRDAYTAFLNSFPKEFADQEPLPKDYFNDHILEADVVHYGMYRYLLIEALTDDDGGSTMLFVHTDVNDLANIEFATSTFDTVTAVWVGPTEPNDYRLKEG